MKITMEMLERCAERRNKQELTPEILEAAKLSRRTIKEKLGFEWSGKNETLDTFWNWVGRFQVSRMEGSKEKAPFKGLLICGPIGSGKSTLAKYLSCKFGLNMYSFHELDKEYGANPVSFRDDYSFIYDKETPIILDDLGTESGIRHYGNEPLARTLFLELYDLWDRYGKLVIVTTNLLTGDEYQKSPDSITSIFGERNQSRFCEMFETIPILCKDLRKGGLMKVPEIATQNTFETLK